MTVQKESLTPEYILLLGTVSFLLLAIRAACPNTGNLDGERLETYRSRRWVSDSSWVVWKGHSTEPQSDTHLQPGSATIWLSLLGRFAFP